MDITDYNNFSQRCLRLFTLGILLVLLHPFNLLIAQDTTYISIMPSGHLRSNAPLFEGDTLVLHASGGKSYEWSGPGNFSSTLQQPQINNVSTSNGGTYFCYIEDDLLDTVFILSIDVAVKQQNPEEIEVDPYICIHCDLSLSCTAGGSGATYSWSDDASTWTASIKNPVFSNINPVGIHNFTVTVTEGGNSVIYSSQVEVLDCCSDQCVQLFYNTTTSNISIQNNTIAVLGELKVDQDFTFPNNQKIIMLPSSYILVEPDALLTLNLAEVVGCEQLWAAIYLLEDAGINADSSFFSDAIAAVESEYDNVSVVLTHDIFYRNVNGLEFHSVNVFTEFEVTQDTFHCYNTMLFPPMSDNKSFSGIFAYGSTIDMISDAGNEFFDMDNGIFSVSTYLDIPSHSTRFTNIKTYTEDQTYIELYGNGIYAGERGSLQKYGRNSTSDIDFTDCQKGINIFNCASTVIRNTMENMDVGVKVTGNSELSTEINYNNIQCSQGGIFLYMNDPVYQMDVSSNTITLDANPQIEAIFAAIRICENNQMPSGSGYEKVTLNQIEVNVGNYGIFSNSSSGTEILNNEIQLNEPDYNISGIQLYNCEYNHVRENVVAGTGSTDGDTSSLYPRGISVAASVDCDYICNSVTDLAAGIAFEEDCDPSEIKGNTFGDHYIGLYYNQNAITGQQEHHGNLWLGSYDSKGAKHASQDPQLIYYSLYTVHQTPSSLVPPSYYPLPFFTVVTGSGQYFECDDPEGGQPVPEASVTDSAIATQNIAFPEFENELMWISGRNLFDRIITDTTVYSGNPLFENYSDSIQNLSEGNYQSLKRDIETVLRLPAAVLNAFDSLQQAYAQVSDSVSALDALIATTNNPALVALYELSRDILINVLYNSLSQIYSIRENYDAQRKNMIEELSEVNSNLPEDSIYEYNEKIFNDIYLNTINNKFLFSQNQSRYLLEIASQCPLKGGTAVYRAWSLYSGICDTAFDYRNICLAEGIIKSLRQPTSAIYDNPHVILFPNPASREVTIRFDCLNENVSFINFFNVLGQKVYFLSLLPSYREYTIKIDELNPGIYQLVFHSDSGNRMVSRLLISR